MMTDKEIDELLKGMRAIKHELAIDQKKLRLAISQCPTPKKRRFLFAKDAALNAMRIGLHAYLCRCGLYHMTRDKWRQKRAS